MNLALWKSTAKYVLSKTSRTRPCGGRSVSVCVVRVKMLLDMLTSSMSLHQCNGSSALKKDSDKYI